MNKIIFIVAVILTTVLILSVNTARAETPLVYDHILIVGDFDLAMQDRVLPQIQKAIADNHGIVLDIQSPGGYTQVEINIANALVLSEQPIIAIVHGYAYSAAALITLTADYTVLSTRSQVLFHMPRSVNSDGKTVRIYDLRSSKGQDKLLARFIAQVSNGARCLLTDQQLRSMMLGNDEISVSLYARVIENNTCDNLPLTGVFLTEAAKGADLVAKFIDEQYNKQYKKNASTWKQWPSINI
jgi:ATP-dependent protease ClpP protease subunit